jgi:anion-transporting  ArsA/GET3 family ATPase
MMSFPGMEEIFSLLKIIELAESGIYDVLIIDCAPTGETLGLLSYPNVLTWWLEKIFPHQRRLLKLARPVAKIVSGGLELPDLSRSLTGRPILSARFVEERLRICFGERISSLEVKGEN